ncbi:hypothetical protein CEXT_247091 [Caerostris extrusa]|uniref:Uncharacterized protein n=1 Tax=Caerostris extrusa TaxID=172846 RepID=A0AAV4XF80_CAEEX|nr:hypothetical protein CEXT_247091 [Caerostris extrusa]
MENDKKIKMRICGWKGDIIAPHSTRDCSSDCRSLCSCRNSIGVECRRVSDDWLTMLGNGVDEWRVLSVTLSKGFRNKWLFCLQMINAMSLPI